MAKIVTLPHNFTPREYQLPLLRAIDGGCKRAVIVWHRRAGKEKTCINLVAKIMPERVGAYYYVFPELNQGRKVLWDGMDRDGFKFLDHFPQEWLAGDPNHTQMKLSYKNDSLFQVVGSDNFNSVMGTNPVFIVFAEYSLQNPQCWSYFRPILAENGGIAVFDFTPRGENHAFDLWCLAKDDPAWFAQLLTVDDTHAISPAVLAQERREIMRLNGNDALFQQEYYCNFTVPIQGAYYADHLMRAYQDGRVGNVPIDPRYLVDTWWDLGVGNNMAIWFVQQVGSELRFVDYMSGGAFGLLEYIGKVRERSRERKFELGKHIGPHDIAAPEISTGKLRIEAARSLGFEFEVCPKIGVDDGIEAASNMFPLCRFDKTHCADGLNSLKNYRRQYDETRKMYVDTPYHDWASHGADAFRTGAVAMDFTVSGRPIKRDAYEPSAPSGRTYNPMTA